MPPVVHILILAAGASSRMRGADKLLQSLDGKPILRRVAETALATGAPVSVALPVGAKARRFALSGLGVKVVEVADATLGMSRSLVRGVAVIAAGKAGPEDGIMILPADMPDFTAEALARLVACHAEEPQWIWRGGTEHGQAGHPTIFPHDLWPALLAVTGDEGGRSVVQAQPERVRILPLPGKMATLDLDTPEDWAAYLGRPA